jgi:hypothetical protein
MDIPVVNIIDAKYFIPHINIKNVTNCYNLYIDKIVELLYIII